VATLTTPPAGRLQVLDRRVQAVWVVRHEPVAVDVPGDVREVAFRHVVGLAELSREPEGVPGFGDPVDDGVGTAVDASTPRPSASNARPPSTCAKRYRRACGAMMPWAAPC
jgi:hypothetical protein